MSFKFYVFIDTLVRFVLCTILLTKIKMRNDWSNFSWFVTFCRNVIIVREMEISPNFFKPISGHVNNCPNSSDLQ